MEIGTEISHKIRSAIKAKLIDLGAYVDDELPDYIMVMVANKKTHVQMCDDLNLFLGQSTDKFTTWLHNLLNKLQTITADEQPSQSEPAAVIITPTEEKPVEEPKTNVQISDTKKNATNQKSKKNSQTAKKALSPVNEIAKPSIQEEDAHVTEKISAQGQTNDKPTAPEYVRVPSMPPKESKTDHMVTATVISKQINAESDSVLHESSTAQGSSENQIGGENVEPELLVRADTDEFSEELSQTQEVSKKKVSSVKQIEEHPKPIKVSSVLPQQRHTMQPRSVQLQMRAKTTVLPQVVTDSDVEDDDNSQESDSVVQTKDMATSPLGNTSVSPKARVVARVSAEKTSGPLTSQSQLSEIVALDCDSRLVHFEDTESSRNDSVKGQIVTTADSSHKIHTKKRMVEHAKTSKHVGGKRSGSPVSSAETVPVKKSVRTRREITSPIRVGSVRPRRAITSPIRVGSVRPRRAITSPIRVETYRPRRAITSPIRVGSVRPRRAITSPIRVQNVYQRREITSPIRVLSLSERLGERIDLSRKRKMPSSVVIQKYIPDIEDEEYDPHNPAVGNVASVIKISRRSSVPVSRQANKALLLRAVEEAEKSVTHTKSLKPIKNQAVIRPLSQRVAEAPPYMSTSGPLRTNTGLMSKSRRQEILQSFKYTIDNDSEPVEQQYVIESSEEDDYDVLETIQDSRFVECSDEDDEQATMEIYEEEEEEDIEERDMNKSPQYENVIEIESSNGSTLDEEVEQSNSDSTLDNAAEPVTQESRLEEEAEHSRKDKTLMIRKAEQSTNAKILDRIAEQQGPLLDELLEGEESEIDSNKEEESIDEKVQNEQEEMPVPPKQNELVRVRVKKNIPNIRTKAILASHTKKLVKHIAVKKSLSESSSQPVSQVLHPSGPSRRAIDNESIQSKYGGQSIRIKCIQNVRPVKNTGNLHGVVEHSSDVHQPVKLVESHARSGTLYSDMAPRPVKPIPERVGLPTDHVSEVRVRPAQHISNTSSQPVKYRIQRIANTSSKPVVKQRTETDGYSRRPVELRTGNHSSNSHSVMIRTEPSSHSSQSDKHRTDQSYSSQPVKYRSEASGNLGQPAIFRTDSKNHSSHTLRHSVEENNYSRQPHRHRGEESTHPRPEKYSSDVSHVPVPVDAVPSVKYRTMKHQPDVRAAPPEYSEKIKTDPVHGLPLRHTPLASPRPVKPKHKPVEPSHRTKFIVTLDGVDTDKYDEMEARGSPQEEIDFENYEIDFDPEPEPEFEPVPTPVPNKVPKKIRLPRIKPLSIKINSPSDEEDDSPKKKSDSSTPMIEDDMEAETPLMRAKMSERCKFWPACVNGNSCQYHHPTVPCKTFPNCQFADKCLYIHPNCKFDSKCSRVDCPFTHASKRMNPSVVQTVQQQILVPAVPQAPPPAQQQCKFYPNCKNVQCPFPHPKPCRYGASCMAKAACSFYHPPIPTKDKLTWTSNRSGNINQSEQETKGILALF